MRKPGATAEDEGWILSYVYDPQRDLGDVVILDAQDFTGEPRGLGARQDYRRRVGPRQLTTLEAEWTVARLARTNAI